MSFDGNCNIFSKIRGHVHNSISIFSWNNSIDSIKNSIKKLFLFWLKGESAPKIVNLKPHNSTVLVRGNAIFECHVFSYPLARISWKKNNKKLNEHNKKYKILHGSNVSFLRITDASHTHNGVLRITCVAENHFGIAESMASLNVISGIIRIRIKNIYFWIKLDF